MVHALIPGSFDPITCGHIDIINRAAQLFDQLTIAIVYNPNKHSFLPLECRTELVKKIFAANSKITVSSSTGLLVDYAREIEAQTLVKGLRSEVDFSYELPMDQMNQHLAQLQTVYLTTAPQYSYISSSLVREIAKLGGDISGLVPSVVEQAVNTHLHL